MSALAIVRRFARVPTLALAIALALALPPAVSAAQAAEVARSAPAAAFERGVATYRAGDYAAAEVDFRAALEAELPPRERARVLYALGNTAYRLERVHESVGWYEAARALAPRDLDLWANLELARRKAGLEPADRGDFRDTVLRLARSLTAAESELALLGALALLLACLCGEALRGGAGWRRACTGAALLVGLACVPWAGHVVARGRDPLLVIAPDGAALRAEPRAELAIIGRAEAGASLERIDELPGWTRIADARGQRGWVPASSVFELRR